MKRNFLYALPALTFLAFSVLAALFLMSGKNPAAIQSPLLGKPVPAFAVDGLANTDIKGPALINFFASWCIPCEAEHPVLKTLGTEFDIYGISYKDDAAARDKFLARLGNPFKKTGNDPDGIAAIAFGVSGVPSTLVVDAEGIIVYRHDAPITEENIEAIREHLE